MKELTTKHKYKLPKSKKEIELKPLYLADLFESIKIARENKHTIITSFLALAIKRIDKKHNISSKDLEDIPLADMEFLKGQTEKLKLEGSIDTEIEHQCSHCKTEFKEKLSCYDSSFFDPSKGSTS
jgi:uncharacterized metal-binding protein YceD (DUF177 family)